MSDDSDADLLVDLVKKSKMCEVVVDAIGAMKVKSPYDLMNYRRRERDGIFVNWFVLCVRMRENHRERR